MATQEQIRRYPGASPFRDRDLDRRAFFGRDRESRSLYHLVKAEQLVVLFAKSGVGKTSLINAGLLEPLRRQGYFPMVVRVNDLKRGPIGSCLDGVRHAAARARVDCVGGDASDLRSFFATAEFWSEGQDLLRPVLILDQFEELFTLYPASPRQEFSRQFAELVRGLPDSKAPAGAAGTLPRLKIVLSLREDYLADLEDLARETPAVVHNRFRLSPLSREEARSAIVEPARLEDEAFGSTPFSYGDDAVQAILDFLARSRWGAETIETDEIEPFQLQLICRQAEEQAGTKRAAGGPSEIEISAEDLGGPDRMRQILGHFYHRTVAAVPSRRAKGAVRRLCERRLISASGRRLTEDEDEIRRRYRLSREQLRQLVDARLLRAEARLGGTFYKLSHDTLIEPIRESWLRRRRWQRVRAGVVIAVPLLILFGFGYCKIQEADNETKDAKLEARVFEAVALGAVEGGTNGAYNLQKLLEQSAGRKLENRRNGTVVDPVTRLQWARQDNGKAVTWYDARDYCEGLQLGGQSDWRLPKFEELVGLYDKTSPKHHKILGDIRLTGVCPWSGTETGDSAFDFCFDWQPDKVSLNTPSKDDRDPALRALCVVGPLNGILGVYTIRQKVNLRYVDAYESVRKGFALVTRPWQRGHDSQKWILTPLGEDVYTIQQKVNLRYVYADKRDKIKSALDTREWQGDDSQKWIITPLGEDVYTIQQKANLLYVDAHVTRVKDYKLVTRPLQGDKSQKWIIN